MSKALDSGHWPSNLSQCPPPNHSSQVSEQVKRKHATHLIPLQGAQHRSFRMASCVAEEFLVECARWTFFNRYSRGVPATVKYERRIGLNLLESHSRCMTVIYLWSRIDARLRCTARDIAQLKGSEMAAILRTVKNIQQPSSFRPVVAVQRTWLQTCYPEIPREDNETGWYWSQDILASTVTITNRNHESNQTARPCNSTTDAHTETPTRMSSQ